MIYEIVYTLVDHRLRTTYAGLPVGYIHTRKTFQEIPNRVFYLNFMKRSCNSFNLTGQIRGCRYFKTNRVSMLNLLLHYVHGLPQRQTAYD